MFGLFQSERTVPARCELANSRPLHPGSGKQLPPRSHPWCRRLPHSSQTPGSQVTPVSSTSDPKSSLPHPPRQIMQNVSLQHLEFQAQRDAKKSIWNLPFKTRVKVPAVHLFFVIRLFTMGLLLTLRVTGRDIPLFHPPPLLEGGFFWGGGRMLHHRSSSL